MVELFLLEYNSLIGRFVIYFPFMNHASIRGDTEEGTTMHVINFQDFKAKRDRIIEKLETNSICVDLMIPTNEVSFWIHLLTYCTHTVGSFLHQEKDDREFKLLRKEYSVLQDMMEKMLVFVGYQFDSTLTQIQFSLSYEEVIILEGQLERFSETCLQYDDNEYADLTKKYVNSLYSIMEDRADEFDQLTNYMIKQVTGR
jgi:uncharacterized protein YkvS